MDFVTTIKTFIDKNGDKIKRSPCYLYTMETTFPAQAILFVQLVLSCIDFNTVKEVLSPYVFFKPTCDAIDALNDNWAMSIIDLVTAKYVCEWLQSQIREIDITKGHDLYKDICKGIESAMTAAEKKIRGPTAEAVIYDYEAVEEEDDVGDGECEEDDDDEEEDDDECEEDDDNECEEDDEEEDDE